MVLIWPAEGDEAETARNLLALGGRDGVGVNYDDGLAFEVSEEVAQRYLFPERAAVIGFDPAEHSVTDVVSYLRTVDLVEQERVVEAERAGRKRKTILATFNGRDAAVS